jgi:thioesterase DpgC
MDSFPRFPDEYVKREHAFTRDAQRLTEYLQRGDALLQRLPPKSRRDKGEASIAEQLKEQARAVRTEFLRVYTDDVYQRLTDSYRSHLRADELVYRAAALVPGLTPTRAAVQVEREQPLRNQEGVQIDQGIFLSMVLAHPRAGTHLIHAMLRPRSDSLERLPAFRREGKADLGTATVERRGSAGYLSLHNPRFLNAEDDSTTDALEIGVDLILLDPEIEVGVMRGATVDHPRYSGRHILGAGINLTRLYYGQISYLFYITRDLGYVNKLYRGLSPEAFHPGEPEQSVEKPWIAAVEGFAIGGGCQLLLVMDRVLAEEGAFFSLPARKEGIIPGAANLRLTRFVGDRLARRAILFDQQFHTGTPEADLLCDEIVPIGEMDVAIERSVAAVTGSGIVSAAGNRKALRLGQEPLELFRAYMALYAREQAYCHFSEALIRNLEVNWDAQNRRLP